MQCLSMMVNFTEFYKKFEKIYTRYLDTGNDRYSYYSEYPLMYRQSIQDIVDKDYAVFSRFISYNIFCISRNFNRTETSLLSYKHAYIIFVTDIRDMILDTKYDFNVIYSTINSMIHSGYYDNQLSKLRLW